MEEYLSLSTVDKLLYILARFPIGIYNSSNAYDVFRLIPYQGGTGLTSLHE